LRFAPVAAAAQEMAILLQAHAELLESAGYSKTFLEEFREEARRLAEDAGKTEMGRAERSQVTREIAAELKSAMQTVTGSKGW
jgi:hypothetical protein